ncbi:hypothetical protein EVAR_60039_1 [Eumeta japonica]|uniref:Uncharacterized protein n=1 Tax=Eumeta variegata TaxID=151549 RepID=A0A4C1YXA2_EUMVA|nr:hypothetical protein EVAR_60039_1 [Eumeta japonica]
MPTKIYASADAATAEAGGVTTALNILIARPLCSHTAGEFGAARHAGHVPADVALLAPRRTSHAFGPPPPAPARRAEGRASRINIPPSASLRIKVVSALLSRADSEKDPALNET